MISDTPTDPRHMYAISFQVSLKSDKIFCEMKVICNKNMKEKTKYINWNLREIRVFYRRIKYTYEFGCVWIKSRGRYTHPNGKADCASIMRCTSFEEAYIDRTSFGYAECKSNKHGPRARTEVCGNSHILTYK